jgi:hypothetical protein
MIPVQARSAGSRRQLLVVGAIFLVPLAAALLLYYGSGWRPAATAHGTLIEPPRVLSAAGSVLPDGRPAPANVFETHWSLVHPASACDERTQALLEELARVRVALGKDATRVRRVLLHGGQCADVAILSRAADLLVLAATAPGGGAFLAQFPPAADGAPGIYVVDPHGNLMMSYPASGSARGLLKDLERLLRLSSIG